MSHRSTLGRLVLAASALLALPAVAFAQTSRVEGMALPGDYIKDYTGIYTYTSGITGVGNLIYGELGTLQITNSTTGYPATFDRAIGTVLGNLWDGRFGTWGIHLREETPALGQGDDLSQPNPGFAGGDPNLHTNESFDVMWGKKFSTMSLGLRLNRSYEALKYELPGVTTDLKFDVPGAIFNGGDQNLARNLWGFGGGVGFEMNANSNLEVSLLYQNRTFEATGPGQLGAPGAPAGADSYKDDGGTTYELAARWMMQVQPNVMFVPVFKYYSFDLSAVTQPTGGGPSVSTDNSLTGWQVGAAGNWTIGNNDLFVLGLTFAQNKVKQQYDLFGISAFTGASPDLEATESIMPNLFAALETHLNNWLTFRMGAQKGAYNKLKVEDNTAGGPTVEFTSSPFTMNIGAGVKLGTLQLDAIVNNFFPQTLGGFFGNLSGPTGITGVSGFTAFPKVTATYSF